MNTVSGLKWGLGLAACYSVFLLLKVTIAGDRVLRLNDLSLFRAIVVYLLAGVVGGAAFGALWRPGLRRMQRIGLAWVVAFVVLVTFVVGVEQSFWGLTPTALLLLAWTSGIIGLVVGTALPALIGGKSQS